MLYMYEKIYSITCRCYFNKLKPLIFLYRLFDCHAIIPICVNSNVRLAAQSNIFRNFDEYTFCKDLNNDRLIVLMACKQPIVKTI